MTLDLTRFEQLINVIEEMAAGNLEARYAISPAHDDVDAIGFGVNILAEELSGTIARLEQEIAEHLSTEAELAKAEKTRREAREELQTLRTARLASIGMLAAGVGHEINNPLTYVVGNVEYLQRKLAEIVPRDSQIAAEIQDVIGDSLEGADRIRRIVADLRQFSRVDDEDPVALDVVEVVESALALVQNEVRHRARLTREYREVPPVLASEPRLAQVLVNLLVNAAHSMSGAGESEIRIVIRPGDDDDVSIEVIDTGAGIAPSDLSRIFEPFFSTKPRAEGTGLGLSICRELISKMGGSIEVESQVGSGTRVRVSLPIAMESASSHELGAPQAPPAPEQAPRVLLVDDDLPVARSVRRMLNGIEVVIAASGREALEILEADRDFHVVLCDLMMPEMSGMELFEAVERLHPDLAERFVFVTGGAFTDRAADFLAKVDHPCIGKPFSSDELDSVIRDRAARG